MCDIALDYASEYDIKFNPLKCQLINFSANNTDIEINFDGVQLFLQNPKALTYVILLE